MLLCALALLAGQRTYAAGGFEVYVSNERSGDVTVIDGTSHKVVATIPVGKRPRGIHASPDGKTVYVALSGTPIEGPPELDANGNPIFRRDQDSDYDVAADKSADGIGVVDVATRRLTRKISVGSDPEEFDLSRDGTQLYVSNEDVKIASSVDIASGKVEHIVALSQEPEGVALSPDGKKLFITCETGGVGPRPRSVAFLQGGKLAVVPSESAGKLYVMDTTQIRILNTIELPKNSRPMRVRVAPDGSRIYASTGRGGTVTVLDGTSYALLDNIAVGRRPWGIALSPDGKFLFSANGPSNDVSVVDLTTNREVARVTAGDSPWGIAIVNGGG
jgi:YVTN family beta-propeller protein